MVDVHSISQEQLDYLHQVLLAKGKWLSFDEIRDSIDPTKMPPSSLGTALYLLKLEHRACIKDEDEAKLWKAVIPECRQ